MEQWQLAMEEIWIAVRTQIAMDVGAIAYCKIIVLHTKGVLARIREMQWCNWFVTYYQHRVVRGDLHPRLSVGCETNADRRDV